MVIKIKIIINHILRYHVKEKLFCYIIKYNKEPIIDPIVVIIVIIKLVDEGIKPKNLKG